MPGRTIHIPIAAGASGVVANICAFHLPTRERVIETAGAAIFGAWSAMLPDKFEPATVGPHHRGPWHAVLPNETVWIWWASQLDVAQDWFRTQADHQATLAAAAQSSVWQLIHGLI